MHLSYPKVGEIKNNTLQLRIRTENDLCRLELRQKLSRRQFSYEKCKVSFTGRKKSKAPMQDRDKLVTGSHTAGKGSVGQSQSVLRLCYWCIMIVREVFSIKLKRLFPLVLGKLHLQYYIQFWKLKWYRQTGQSKAAKEIWKIWSVFFFAGFLILKWTVWWA